jgi:hypothetical protein
MLAFMYLKTATISHSAPTDCSVTISGYWLGQDAIDAADKDRRYYVELAL